MPSTSSTEKNFYLENTDLVSPLPRGNKIVPILEKSGELSSGRLVKRKHENTPTEG